MSSRSQVGRTGIDEMHPLGGSLGELRIQAFSFLGELETGSEDDGSGVGARNAKVDLPCLTVRQSLLSQMSGWSGKV